jgi:sugar lactone lactonase YvrE
MNKPTPLPAELTPYPIVANITFAEGPSFDDLGNLYFVNYAHEGTIGRLTPGGTVTIWVHTGGSAGGTKYDGDGHIGLADSGAGRITRFDVLTRKMEILTEEFEGQPYLRPNDLTLDRFGNIYFTVPAPSEPSKERLGAVYRINMSDDNSPTGVDRLLADVPVPNGLAVLRDPDRFYLALTVRNSIVAYDIAGDGSLVNENTVIEFPDRSVDGIAFDEHQRLWVARWTHGSVAVVDVERREQLADYPMGVERVTNLAFWENSLYVSIAARSSVERLDVGCRGLAITPDWSLRRRP